MGSRDDSSLYIRMKRKAAAEVGLKVDHIKLPREVGQRVIVISCMMYRFLIAFYYSFIVQISNLLCYIMANVLIYKSYVHNLFIDKLALIF